MIAFLVWVFRAGVVVVMLPILYAALTSGRYGGAVVVAVFLVLACMAAGSGAPEEG